MKGPNAIAMPIGLMLPSLAIVKFQLTISLAFDCNTMARLVASKSECLPNPTWRRALTMEAIEELLVVVLKSKTDPLMREYDLNCSSPSGGGMLRSPENIEEQLKGLER